jgi:thiol-disulfide isomerase/thioredoxin
MKMKNQTKIFKSLILIAILSVMLISCGQKKTPVNKNLVIVAGQITNPNSDSAWVRIEPKIGRDFTSFGARLDDNNSFNIHFDIDEPLPVTFYDGNETTQMFVQPGDSIYITLDTKEFDETIKYSGTGADKNNFLAQNYLKFIDGYSIWDLLDSLPPDQYKMNIDERMAGMEKMLKEFTSNHKVSPQFINFEQTELAFGHAFDLYMYINSKRDRKIGYDTVNIPVEFYEEFSSMANYKNPYEKSKQYNIYYNFYYPSYLAVANSDILKGTNGAERDSILLSVYQSNLDGYEKERVIANYFYGKISRYNVDYFEKNKAYFDENVKNDMLKLYVLNEYDKVKKQLSLDMPEGAHLVNLERKEYSNTTFKDVIAKYKGNVIYLDFWASWCGPCKGEMPFSLEMQDYFKGKDVAFVYFSSDKDSVAWKQMIKILQISGDHYRVSKKIYKEYNKLYNVRYIPRYMIIDKNGKTVDDKAKRPSDLTVRQDIEALL